MNEVTIQPAATAGRPFTIDDLRSFFDPASASAGRLGVAAVGAGDPVVSPQVGVPAPIDEAATK